MAVILGHDCDGRALCAGDSVVIVESGKNEAGEDMRWLEGLEGSVVGPSTITPEGWGAGMLEVDVPAKADGRLSRCWNTYPEELRRIGGAWDQIERVTAWRPEAEKA